MKLSANDRFLAAVKLLIDSNDYVSVEEIADFLDASKRSIYYIISDINATLRYLDGEEITTVYGKGIRLNHQQKKLLLNYYKKAPSEEIFSLSQIERCSVIYATLYASDRKYNIKTYEELFRVSRFTVISDINQIRNIISHFDISIGFDSKTGYRLEGGEYNIRKAFFYFFANIYEIITSKEWLSSIFVNETLQIRKYYNKLKKIAKENHNYYDMSLLAIALVIAKYMQSKKGIGKEKETDLLPVEQMAEEYVFVCKEFKDLPDIEKRWISTYLSCSLISREHPFVDLDYATTLARKMNDVFYLYSSIRIESEDLVTSLAKHIDSAFLRYKYGVCINNPLISEIRNKYDDYFMIVKKTVQVLEQEFGMPINDSEIGFLTLYYAGYAIKLSKQIPYIRTLIICAIGLSTSYLLKNEIEDIDSRIKVIGCVSAEEYLENDYDVDLIISTVRFEKKKKAKVYQISSFVTGEDRSMIVGAVNEIMAEKNTERSPAESSTKEEIDSSGSLKEIFKPEYVRITENEKDADWRKLLKEACEPLVKDGFIDEDYSSYIEENIDKYGFYMLYRNGYLLGHANIEHAHRLGLTFTRLKNKIMVDGHEISKIFVITPINRFDHHFILSGLSVLFKSDELNQLIEKADSSSEIYDIILSIIAVY
ncbi:MAG: BglG family transcription antiterminator [Erysipelotrichaceae bacterium]|nr:BglG family transcription antiterminator [Erysipelotrichaceae bacterium]